MAAVPAQHDRRGPAPVEHEDRLLTGRRVERPERGRQVARDEAAHPGRQLGPEVDDLDGRRGPDRADRQHDPVVDAGPRPADAVDGGRGRPEHDRRARQLAQPDRHVARLEPRCPVALVRGIVLLVDDDEPDIGQRSDDGQPRPDDDVHLARPDAPPLVGALAVAEARVDERDPRVEVRPQPVDERQGQGDLGDQDEGRPAGLERGRDRLHVDRGLAAAGHPVEQERTRIPGPDRGDDLPDRLRLGGQEIARRGTAATQPDGSGGQRPARPLADIGIGEPSTDEPRDRRVAVPAGEVRRRQLPGGRGGELPERGDLARSETAAPWWSRRSPATSRRRDPPPRGRSSAHSAGPSRRRSASTPG